MENYEKCNGCSYYFGEIDNCMFGEPDVPDDLERKCALGVDHQWDQNNEA